MWRELTIFGETRTKEGDVSALLFDDRGHGSWTADLNSPVMFIQYDTMSLES